MAAEATVAVATDLTLIAATATAAYPQNIVLPVKIIANNWQ
jgi:hypothetical protein